MVDFVKAVILMDTRVNHREHGVKALLLA